MDEILYEIIAKLFTELLQCQRERDTLHEACEMGNVDIKGSNVLEFTANMIEQEHGECNCGCWELARMLRQKAAAERVAIAKARGER